MVLQRVKFFSIFRKNSAAPKNQPLKAQACCAVGKLSSNSSFHLLPDSSFKHGHGYENKSAHPGQYLSCFLLIT